VVGEIANEEKQNCPKGVVLNPISLSLASAVYFSGLAVVSCLFQLALVVAICAAARNWSRTFNTLLGSWDGTISRGARRSTLSLSYE
jgi:hypothetical protein